MVGQFSIETQWLEGRSIPSEGIAATIGDLTIKVADRNVTSYETSSRDREESIRIPLYYVAEWLAVNWWAILWEPHKNDEIGDEPDFRSRHWLINSQHGFALPNVQVVSTGEAMSVYAEKRTPQYADAFFNATSNALVSRTVLEQNLRSFIESVSKRAGERKLDPLYEAWSLVQNTGEEAQDFCRLIGALGLSPYDTHPGIEQALDMASEILSAKQIEDLCLTSTPDNIVKSTYVAAFIQTSMATKSNVAINMLPSIELPRDRVDGPAWNVGARTAQRLRTAFHLKDDDLIGSSKVFDQIGLDVGSKSDVNIRVNDLTIIGAVDRLDTYARVALTQDGLASRRFAAARATYLLLRSDIRTSRLITTAATRDQQASRAFAAELLVPHSAVRERSRNMKLPQDVVYELAVEATVSPEVIRYQAVNHGLTISR